MNAYKEQIDLNRLPQHIAVIMDGNGRWAKRHGKHRIFGHSNGVKAVRETSEACAELGIKYLTLYAFSTENWNRPQDEVSALMELLLRTVRLEIDTLMKNDIRLRAIGNIEALPAPTRRELNEAIKKTSGNKRMDLILALSYSGKSELTRAVQQIATDAIAGKISPEDITEQLISKYLYTTDIPDPELLIRTSGEKRISNFLLWQLAYTELYFTDLYWPDFNKDELYKAIIDFQSRQRRFGKTSEQLQQLTV
ncbi:MAG: isoprenyl transferase [Chitinophagales bacterium]|nr:isoprenyl transferase [Chitinophagales bacterium]MDW8273837.1 isoprenyl transferase [Chitinophagales bacterium]